jgi:hypothetical protein
MPYDSIDSSAWTRVFTQENFTAFRDAIRPTPDEMQWQSIPWIPDLATGLDIARRERKPVLLWGSCGP